MKRTAFLLALFASSAPAAAPRYAEELPQDTSHAVVLKLVPDDGGWVRFCTLHGVHESSPQGPALSLTPSDAYVADACRKLSSKKWKIERDDSGEIKPVFYFCRYLESTPERAYCERRFND